MPADLTVVIPAYNRARSLRRCLTSVTNQQLQPAKIIVVDDGSTDATADTIATFQKNCPDGQFQSMHQDHQGVSKARNTGLEAAGTKLIAFLDSDDCWPADFTARTTKALSENSDAVGAITAQYWRINPRMPRQTIRRLAGRTIEQLGLRPIVRALKPDLMAQHTSYLPANPVQWMVRYGAGISSCSVFRTRIIRDLGGFDESLQTGEDSALYLPLSLRGQWVYVPGQPVLYGTAPERYGDEPHLSWSFTDNYRRWAESYEAIFAKHDFSQVFPMQQQRQALLHLWEHAAKELQEQGLRSEAAICEQKIAEYKTAE